LRQPDALRLPGAEDPEITRLQPYSRSDRADYPRLWAQFGLDGKGEPTIALAILVIRKAKTKFAEENPS
jgi:hypothetical protein